MDDKVIQLHTPERPCDTEASDAPEGYRLQHMNFGDINEPTCSNPFPWVRFREHCGKAHWRVHLAQDKFIDVPVSRREALCMVEDLARFAAKEQR
ncbi:hypothetical protein [Methyloceanibacter caenitepidi]|uniref:Uncharacterized protein n=1 Tax=Methyloceanibacter caenitepidi TaxID=1384459 RepID=A0A0A8K8G6_9HYPH|nr:hypothetical protein [Methyloceanibacter caenitepidi]BAQ18279.1 hypothetical protein GL4_2846 [Methyloceanibacter caenitepidi]